MTRTRASIEGGYARKTVSLPKALVVRIGEYLREHKPDMTLSGFMTKAAEHKINQLEKRNGK